MEIIETEKIWNKKYGSSENNMVIGIKVDLFKLKVLTFK